MNEYDPVHNVDDAKGYEQANPERIAVYAAAVTWRTRDRSNKFKLLIVNKSCACILNALSVVLTTVDGYSSDSVEQRIAPQ